MFNCRDGNIRKKKENKDSVIGGNLISNKVLQVEYKELGKNKQTARTTTFHSFFFLASFKVN